MKNINILICLVLLFTGCKQDDVEFIFEKQPEARIAEKLGTLQSALVSASYGWKAALNTNASGGYGFYMNFKEDQTLDMISDFSNTSSTTVKTSTYRVTWTMDAVLMFDTYNYITQLQDPTPSVNGGTAGNGLLSDIEFELLKVTTDTVTLRGKRYANILTLVKLNAEEQKSYLEGGLKSSIDKIGQYFSRNSNNYIAIDGLGEKIEFVPTSTKGVVFQYVAAGGAVTSISGKFNYELNGFNFNIPIVIGSETMVGARLEQDKFSLLGKSGTKYTLSQNATPILPIETLFAYNKTYNTLHFGLSQPAGITSGFNAIYNTVKSRFAAMSPARHILQCYFKLASSTKAEVGVQSQVSPNGTTYATGLATYDYKLTEDGVITLSNPVYDNNFIARTTQLGPISDYFLSGPFKLVYVTSSDPSVSNIGGLYPLNDTNNVFYGALRK